jgi:hypothetical protein
MTKVQALQEKIIELDSDDFAQLLKWMNEREWDEWDREIEEDSANGRLDAFFEEARREHREGKTTKL